MFDAKVRFWGSVTIQPNPDLIFPPWETETEG